MEKKDAISVFVPGLQDTPGWTALSQTKRDELLEHTSRLQQFRIAEALSSVAACMELQEVEDVLQNEPMTMSAYLRTVYRESAKTAERRMKDYREMRKHWSPEIISAVASRGATLLRGMSGVQLKTLVNISKSLPEPKSKEDKVIDAWISEDVRKRIQAIKGRHERAVKVNEFDASRMAFNAVLRYLRQAKLKTSREQSRWLQRVVGWTMEAQAIHGVFKAGRVSIPEGVIARVGRPPNKKKESPKQAA